MTLRPPLQQRKALVVDLHLRNTDVAQAPMEFQHHAAGPADVDLPLDQVWNQSSKRSRRQRVLDQLACSSLTHHVVHGGLPCLREFVEFSPEDDILPRADAVQNYGVS